MSQNGYGSRKRSKPKTIYGNCELEMKLNLSSQETTAGLRNDLTKESVEAVDLADASRSTLNSIVTTYEDDHFDNDMTTAGPRELLRRCLMFTSKILSLRILNSNYITFYL